MARRAGPNTVTSLTQFLVAQGYLPRLRVNNDKVVLGPFMAGVTITDNATVDADLTLQSVWDGRVQELYGSSSSSSIKGTLRLVGARLYINDSNYRAETLALKESLDNLVYLRVQRGNRVLQMPLRNCIYEPWAWPQVTQQTAADGDFAVQKGGFYMLDKGGVNVDMFTDQLSLRVDTAINWGSGNIVGYVQVLGALAPDNYPGADSSIGCAEDPGAVAPGTFTDMVISGYGKIGPQTFGGMGGGMNYANF